MTQIIMIYKNQWSFFCTFFDEWNSKLMKSKMGNGSIITERCEKECGSQIKIVDINVLV
jgi:hypothetical protein